MPEKKLAMKTKTTIDDKIRRMKQWKGKYPEAKLSISKIPYQSLRKYSITSEEYKTLYNEYKELQKYYKYLIERKHAGALSEEQILECREIGIFGYPSKVIKNAEEYKQQKKDINYIINNYQSLDNFRNLYRKMELPTKDYLLAKNIIRSSFDVDYSSNEGDYESLLNDILNNENKLKIYSSRALNEILDSLELRESYVINSRYGLNGEKKKTLKELGEELNVSSERIRAIQQQVIRKLRKTCYAVQYYFNVLCGGEKLSEKEEIINFLNPEEQEMIRNLISKIDNSNVVYYNRKKEISQESIKDEEIVRGIEIIKGIKEISNKRMENVNEENTQAQKREKVENEEDEILIQNYFDLPVAIYHSLIRSKVNTVGDIKKLKIEDLYKMRNMGSKRCEELISILNERGIVLESRNEESSTANSKQIKMMTMLESMKKKKEELQIQAKYLEDKILQAEKLLHQYKENNEKKSNDNKSVREKE